MKKLRIIKDWLITKAIIVICYFILSSIFLICSLILSESLIFILIGIFIFFLVIMILSRKILMKKELVSIDSTKIIVTSYKKEKICEWKNIQLLTIEKLSVEMNNLIIDYIIQILLRPLIRKTFA